MSTSQEIKEAADALAVAKTVYDAAFAEYQSKQAEVTALITVEQAAVDTAIAALSAAAAAAQLTVVGYDEAQAAFFAANNVRSDALIVLSDAAAQFDQTY